MKFLLDANVEYRIAYYLLALHHDVKTIAHDYPHSLSDPEVLAIAVQEKRILITNDTDFGELIFHHNHAHYGVVLFRFKSSKDVTEKLRGLETVLHTYSDSLHDYCVITPRGVRIRRILEDIAV